MRYVGVCVCNSNTLIDELFFQFLFLRYLHIYFFQNINYLKSVLRKLKMRINKIMGMNSVVLR